jgi:methyl-accepting chemotaxis protein
MIGSNSLGRAQSGERTGTSTSANRRSFFASADSQFQWRYAFSLALAVGLTLVLFMAPFLYLMNQNFEIFYQLAMRYQPDLMAHLEREVRWITTLGLVGLISAVVFSLAFGYKLTGSIVGPLFSMERHMKKVANGDWAQNDFRVRASDEFKRLSTSYSHLYRTVRNQTEEDLETLQELEFLLNSERNQLEVRALAQKLIAERRKKLGIQAEEFSGEDSASGSVVLPLNGDRPSLPVRKSKRAS